MKTAVMFGGGNIGRGFIGAALADAGYRVIFADINGELIKKINELGSYTVHIMDVKCNTHKVKGVSCVNSTSQDVVNEITDADLVTTAVGLLTLPYIADAVAKGIKARQAAGCKNTMNIIACENAIRASSQLKKAVYDKLDKKSTAYADKYIGFPDCTVDRIVPPMKINKARPLDVAVENYYEWCVEGTGFKGEIPNVPAMHIVDNVMAYLERKLFTLNTGHCIAAYLGVIKGYETIDQAVNDEYIYNVVKGAMIESGNGLIAKHGFAQESHLSYIETCLDRFRNPYLRDELFRVGRQPYRKLAATDRLVGPLLNARKYGLSTDNLIKGIAAGLHYNHEGDSQSQEMQQKIRHNGVLKTAIELTGIEDKRILTQIVKEYSIIKENLNCNKE